MLQRILTLGGPLFLVLRDLNTLIWNNPPKKERSGFSNAIEVPLNFCLKYYMALRGRESFEGKEAKIRAGGSLSLGSHVLSGPGSDAHSCRALPQELFDFNSKTEKADSSAECPELRRCLSCFMCGYELSCVVKFRFGRDCHTSSRNPRQNESQVP